MARFDAVAQDDFPALERVMWCGEVLPTPVLAHWMRRLPHVRVHQPLRPDRGDDREQLLRRAGRSRARRASAIPIGRPCPGEELLVLDGDAGAPVGEIGELYIGGVGLTPGYWRDEEKTAAAFLRGPA